MGKNCGGNCKCKHKTSKPESSCSCYAHKVVDKAMEKSPYGEKEPSTHTHYK